MIRLSSLIPEIAVAALFALAMLSSVGAHRQQQAQSAMYPGVYWKAAPMNDDAEEMVKSPINHIAYGVAHHDATQIFQSTWRNAIGIDPQGHQESFQKLSLGLADLLPKEPFQPVDAIVTSCKLGGRTGTAEAELVRRSGNVPLADFTVTFAKRGGISRISRVVVHWQR